MNLTEHFQPKPPDQVDKTWYSLIVVYSKIEYYERNYLKKLNIAHASLWKELDYIKELKSS